MTGTIAVKPGVLSVITSNPKLRRGARWVIWRRKGLRPAPQQLTIGPSAGLG